MSQSCQGLTTVITFEIFISTNKIFLKIQYFPSQFFLGEKLIISENNIISIEAAKVVG
jgi:hypothetical protein